MPIRFIGRGLCWWGAIDGWGPVASESNREKKEGYDQP